MVNVDVKNVGVDCMSNNSEARSAYLDWLLTPPSERAPKTKKAFAEQYNVHRNTLRRWENSKDFISAMRNIKLQWGVQFHPHILDRLMRIVGEGSDRDAIQASRVLLNHLDVTPSEREVQEVDDDTLAELRSTLKDGGFIVVSDE